MENKYDDIINLPHHVSPARQSMSIADRAAQFAPFAALTGFEGSIRETARLTNEKIQLDDNMKVELDEKLQLLISHIADNPKVKITYFVLDHAKDGGKYVDFTGVVRRIDEFNRTIIFLSGEEIQIDDILFMDSEIFNL